jgi:hypothetical protein
MKRIIFRRYLKNKATDEEQVGKYNVWQISTTFVIELFQPYGFTVRVLGTGHFVSINVLFPELILLYHLKFLEKKHFSLNY